MIKDAGQFKHRIEIFRKVKEKDAQGFPVTDARAVIMTAWAKVKTTKGFTLIANGTDFEKAYTNFTIRYSPLAETIDRKCFIAFGGKEYTIEYLNNIDEMGVELEIQAKEVTH